MSEPLALAARARRNFLSFARYGVKAINRALQGIGGTTVVHLCFGYAAAVKDKPTGYSFLPQLADTTASQISRRRSPSWTCRF